MKHMRIIFLLILVSALLASCSQKTETPAPAAAPAADSAATQTAPAAASAPEAASTPASTPAPAELGAEEDSGGAPDLTILYEQDDSMINSYSLLAVNPDAPFVDADGKEVGDVEINADGAEALINWMLSEEAETLASNYGFDDYGEYLFYLYDTAPVSESDIPEATDDTRIIRLSTTTSVNDSGLLGYLLPEFEQAYGYSVEVYSAGTGKSIANAKAGNADLILVHSKKQEEAFIEEGYSYVLDGFESERLTFLYNYFVLCGPSEDPAEAAAAESVKDAFARIAETESLFVSRGDKSGTHTKELTLWPEALGITDSADSVQDYPWYVYSNAGMGVCLTMAEEMGAYILSDKATFLTFQAGDR